MEVIKQRGWIIIPVFACVVAITLIAMRAQANAVVSTGVFDGGSGNAGSALGAQTGKQLLAGADWTMEGLNPARTRSREEPLAQPLTKQRAVKIPGDTGEGSPPTVSDNILFVETPDDLRAVDMMSGKQRWYARFPGTYVSPTVADGRVYVRSEASNKGNLLALDIKDGKQLWSFTPIRLSSSRTNYLGGHLTSPVVIDGRVIVGAGMEVYALDATTGDKIWQYSGEDLISSSATIADGKIYIADFSHINALDLLSGKLLWSYATDSSVSFAPIAAGQSLFATNGHDVVALDTANGTERWTAHYPDIDLIPGAAAGSLVYLKSTTTLYALDTASGKEVWQYRDPNFVSMPSVAGKDLVLISGNGPGSALEILNTQTGESTWRMPFKELANSAPVIAGQTVYVRTTDGRVMSFWH